jgi:hypothetical protein
MARPLAVSDVELQRVWRREGARLLRRPSGREMASALSVSQRTVWRYMRRLEWVENSRTCPTCHGEGRVRGGEGARR